MLKASQMERIRSLLAQVAIVSKKNAEILDATGGRFNMFGICGVNHYENTHSAIIAELLNPDGSHGLKSKLLDCFIRTLGDDFTVRDFNCDKSQVRTEFSTEEGRIDILIEDNGGKAVIIENKIYADDQWEQLKRYDRYSANRYGEGNYQILYLTLDGNEASGQSGGGIAYTTVSYRETIVSWLERCVSIAVRSPIVRETVIQYINHIKQLTNQDMDTKNRSEIIDILSKTENLKAARTIYRNYLSVFGRLADEHFNPGMEEFAKEKGLEYHYERSDELYIRFYVTNPLWQGKCWIGFTFESNRYHYGICNNVKNYRISDDNRATLRNLLTGMGVVSCKESDWWPFYAYLPSMTLDVWEQDVVRSDRFVNVCKEKIEQLLCAMSRIEL